MQQENCKYQSRKLRKENRTRGRWTDEENRQYAAFLRENFGLFETQDNRRKHQVFRAMAKQIVTRDYEQCRCHHQKLWKKYSNLQKIILCFETVPPAIEIDEPSTKQPSILFSPPTLPSVPSHEPSPKIQLRNYFVEDCVDNYLNSWSAISNQEEGLTPGMDFL